MQTTLNFMKFINMIKKVPEICSREMVIWPTNTWGNLVCNAELETVCFQF